MTSDRAEPPPAIPAWPAEVRALFWDCDPDGITLERHADFVLGRVLSRGDWKAVRWLRGTVGDEAVADYLARTSGRLLSPRQLRLWETILDLPRERVTAWIQRPERRVWDGRGA